MKYTLHILKHKPKVSTIGGCIMGLFKTKKPQQKTHCGACFECGSELNKHELFCSKCRNQMLNTR